MTMGVQMLVAPCKIKPLPVSATLLTAPSREQRAYTEAMADTASVVTMALNAPRATRRRRSAWCSDQVRMSRS